jgi:hypothetical protein
MLNKFIATNRKLGIFPDILCVHWMQNLARINISAGRLNSRVVLRCTSLHARVCTICLGYVAYVQVYSDKNPEQSSQGGALKKSFQPRDDFFDMEVFRENWAVLVCRLLSLLQMLRCVILFVGLE